VLLPDRAEEFQRFIPEEPSRFGCAYGRDDRRVEPVHIHREVDVLGPDGADEFVDPAGFFRIS